MKYIVADQHQQVATWVAAGIPMMELGEQYTTLGLIDERGYLHAGIVYNTYTGNDIILSIRLLNEKAITRRFIVEGFRYPFQQLGCGRVTVLVARRNKASQRFVKRLGWRYEGTLREWYPDAQDAIVFGMLRRECRWLSIVRQRHGSVRSDEATRSGRSTGNGRPDGRPVDPRPGGLPAAAPGEPVPHVPTGREPRSTGLTPAAAPGDPGAIHRGTTAHAAPAASAGTDGRGRPRTAAGRFSRRSNGTTGDAHGEG